MRATLIRHSSFIAFIILFLSCGALLINYFLYQYPGNNYFPEKTISGALILLLTYIGSRILFGKNHRISQSFFELLCFFGVMSLIAFATNAIQLTPFPPIDEKILKLESLFHINISAILKWTNEYPSFKKILEIIYDTLPYQMSFIPLFVLVSGRFHLLKDYYFLMLLTTLLGFSFYYFFPTTAPASMINSPFFAPEQLATGYKFNQIHHHIAPTTIDGGLIALPSFHTVWALLCTYLLKDWLFPFLIVLAINILLILSCVLLGWHYPSDIITGIALVLFGYFMLPKKMQ